MRGLTKFDGLDVNRSSHPVSPDVAREILEIMRVDFVAEFLAEAGDEDTVS